jgi:hypothetical protein
MDITAFYAVVAGINFTLLGLWWVAVQDRPDLRRPEYGTGRMAYIVSLQFVVPGTASLLSQVAPDVGAVWQTAFILAGLAGMAGIIMVAPALLRAKARAAALMLLWGGVPLYLLVTIVALLETLHLRLELNLQLTGLRLEAILFCLLVLLGTQTAWAVAMSPTLDQTPADSPAV